MESSGSVEQDQTTDKAKDEQGGTSTLPAEKQDGTPGEASTDGNDGEKGKEEVDAREVFKRAKSALDDATSLHAAAKKYAEAPPRLSEDFIAKNFPFDKDDGKYGFCVICGTAGDLLCCDTPTCPNTVHPECAKITEIPEGDWFCGRCPVAGGNANSTPDKTDATDSKLETQEKKGDADDGENPKSGSESAEAPKETSKQDEAVRAEKDAQVANDSGSKEVETDEATTQHVGKIPPIFTFDEKKSVELTAELDQLYFLRTGRRRGLKTEEAAPDKSSKLQEDVAKVETGPKIPLGTKFQKKFGRYGYYTGTVTSLPSERIDHRQHR